MVHQLKPHKNLCAGVQSTLVDAGPRHMAQRGVARVCHARLPHTLLHDRLLQFLCRWRLIQSSDGTFFYFRNEKTTYFRFRYRIHIITVFVLRMRIRKKVMLKLSPFFTFFSVSVLIKAYKSIELFL